MAFHRHFVEREDFELKVVSNAQKWPEEEIGYKPVRFGVHPFTSRIFRTRLNPLLYGFHSLNSWGRLPKEAWREAVAFQPNAVFTIAGSWDYSALIARRVSLRIGVPLIASFNDWFDYGGFLAHPIFHPIIERRFRRFYKEADLALCTCEGMREALGPHPKSHVLYPIGAKCAQDKSEFIPYTSGDRSFVVAFAGSMGDWYGPMLESLVQAARAQSAEVEFQFFGSNPSWSQEFDKYARTQNIYRGHLPFEELRKQVAGADALILPMGFGDNCAQVERTSFKTKFLDYLSYQKPILVWGPEYCSAARVAREFDSAEICSNPDASAILAQIQKLSIDPQRQRILVQNARKMYEDRFHPDKIHDGLVRAINETIQRCKT